MQVDCEEGVNACVGNERRALLLFGAKGNASGTLMMITTTQVTGAWEGKRVNFHSGR